MPVNSRVVSARFDSIEPFFLTLYTFIKFWPQGFEGQECLSVHLSTSDVTNLERCNSASGLAFWNSTVTYEIHPQGRHSAVQFTYFKADRSEGAGKFVLQMEGPSMRWLLGENRVGIASEKV